MGKAIRGSGKDDLQAITYTGDGYLLAGSSGSPADGDKTEKARGLSDFWVINVDETGNKLWDKQYGSGGEDNLVTMKQTQDGGFILAGNSTGINSYDKSEPGRGDFDYWIIKIDATGTKQWDKTMGGNNSDYLSTVIQISDGSYLLGGTSRSGADADKTDTLNGSSDNWVIKLGNQSTSVQNIKGNLNTIIYPNPAQSEATITFETKKSGVVKISLLDITGSAVAMLSDKYFEAGNNQLTFNTLCFTQAFTCVPLKHRKAPPD